jgi:ABC-type transporter Mla MlaB component
MGGGTLDNTITFQQNPQRVFDDPCGNFPVFTQESFNQWITDTCNNEAPGFTDGSLNYLISFDAPYTIIGSNVLKDLSNIDICNTEGASLTDKFAHPEALTDICDSAFRNMNLTGGLDFSKFSALKTIGPDAFSKNNFNDTIIFGKNSTLTDILSRSSVDSGAFYNSNISGPLDLSGLSALESIGIGTFANNKITALDLSGLNYLRTINDFAFVDNSISSVNFNGLSNLQNIYDAAFSANLLSNLELKDLSSLVSIGINTFNQNIIEDISLLNCPSLNTIGENAFASNPLTGSLTLRNVPSLNEFPITGISKTASFEGNLELTGTGFTEIGDFSNGSFQGSLTINDNQDLTSIDVSAFSDNSFTSLELSGNTALTIVQSGSFANNNFVDGVTFTNCPSLQSIQGGFGDGGAFYQSNISGSLDLKELTALQILGPQAFSDNNITDLELDGLSALQTIGYSAFANNDLSSVDFTTLSALAEFGSYAFTNNNLTSLDLSGLSALERVFTFAFSDNSLTSVDFTGLTALISIANSAFTNNNISSVNFSDLSALIIIGNAFVNNNITDISFINDPSLSSIESNAFDENPLTGSLTLRNVPSLAAFPHEAIDVYGFTGNLELTGTGFTEIGDFINGSFTGSLTINANLDLSSINESAFTYNLFTSLDLSGNTDLTIIQKGSFAYNNFVDGVTFTNCPSLQSIEGGDIGGAFSYSNIGSLTFNTLPGLTNIGDIGDGYGAYEEAGIPGALDLSGLTNLQTIGVYAFAFNDINSVDFTGLNALQTIGDTAFDSNSLTSVDFTDLSALQTIGVSAFAYNNISSVDFSGLTALQTIGDSAFRFNNITDISLINDPSLSSIDSGAFVVNPLTGSLMLRNVPSLAAFPHNAIPTDSFEGNLELTGTGFTEIGDFSNGSFQGSLTINDNLDLSSINENAFKDNSFTSLELSGNTALTIVQKGSFAFNNFIDGVTFTNCPSLQSIQGGNSTSDGAFYQSNISGPLDLKELTALQTIGRGTFFSNNLTSVDFTGLTALQTIGIDAFSNNDLTSVDFSGLTALQTISGSAFFNNNDLTSVDFTGLNDLQTIGVNAFSFNNISSVDFSGLTALQTIGLNAFANNLNLTEFRFFDNSGCTLGSNVYPDLSGVSSSPPGISGEIWDNSGFTIPTNGLYIWNVPP